MKKKMWLFALLLSATSLRLAAAPIPDTITVQIGTSVTEYSGTMLSVDSVGSVMLMNFHAVAHRSWTIRPSVGYKPPLMNANIAVVVYYPTGNTLIAEGCRQTDMSYIPGSYNVSVKCPF